MKYLQGSRPIGSDGSIILISSSSAQNTILPYLPYAASKAALNCLVRYAALEYGRQLGRIGEPEHYADAVLWLAGPAFVTGLNSFQPALPTWTT